MDMEKNMDENISRMISELISINKELVSRIVELEKKTAGISTTLPVDLSLQEIKRNGNGGDCSFSGGLPNLRFNPSAREGYILLKRMSDGKTVAFDFDDMIFKNIDLDAEENDSFEITGPVTVNSGTNV